MGVVAGVLAGCANTQNYAQAVKSWVGAPTRKLFTVWGYPDRQMKLQNGNTLYVYVDEQKGETPPTMFPGYTTVRKSQGQTVVSSTPPVFTGSTRYDLRCVTWFEVNKRSRVVGTSFRGNDCIASESFRKQYSRQNSPLSKKNKS